MVAGVGGVAVDEKKDGGGGEDARRCMRREEGDLDEMDGCAAEMSVLWAG